MTHRDHKESAARAPADDATGPADLPPAAEGWDDATCTDPPRDTDALFIPPDGGTNTESTAAQEIIAALGKALRSPLPGRALDEEETVGLFSDPLPARRGPGKHSASPPPAARPSTVAKPARPAAPAPPDLDSEVPISWEEPSITTDAAAGASPRSGPSGPFGVDSTELDLKLWAVEPERPSTQLRGAPRPSAPRVEGWSPPTARVDAAPIHAAPIDEEPELPAWDDEPHEAPRTGPVLNADGVIEHAQPRAPAIPALANPAPAIPRVVVGRPLEDPSDDGVARRPPTRVRPAGPASLDEPDPSAADFEVGPPTNTLARFGNIAVAKKKTFELFGRKPPHAANPGARPGGVGVPVGAERRSYRVLSRIFAIAAVLIIGVLIGFLITVSLKG